MSETSLSAETGNRTEHFRAKNSMKSTSTAGFNSSFAFSLRMTLENEMSTDMYSSTAGAEGHKAVSSLLQLKWLYICVNLVESFMNAPSRWGRNGHIRSHDSYANAKWPHQHNWRAYGKDQTSVPTIRSACVDNKYSSPTSHIL
jgi:hypothetical protein